MRNLFIITKREYLQKIRNKSFIVMTFVSPIIVILFGGLIAYLTSVNKASNGKKIAILDETHHFEKSFQNSENITYNYLTNSTLASAKEKVLSDNLYGLLYISSPEKNIQFFSEESPHISLINEISTNIETTLFENELAKKGIDKADIETSKIKIPIEIKNFSGEKKSELDSLIRIIFGGAVGYLIFMFIIIYGNMIMRSVIEEKTNRIIEIIISSVKPFELLLGKIFGTSLAGITQFLIWMIFGGILMTLTTSFSDIYPSSGSEVLLNRTGFDKFTAELLFAFFKFPFLEVFFAFLAYFIGGYLLYSSFYAAIGAMVDSETDTQQFLLPILTPLMLAVYIGFFSVIEEPHGTISVIFSYIPLTSPIVMLMRIPFGVHWWEVLISLVLLYGSFFLVIKIAAKIYRIGILMYGKKASYKEIKKWLFY